jgi:hypothetical protein
LPSITNLSSVNSAQGSGIVLDYRLQNITIGKPGKGNVICGNIAWNIDAKFGFYPTLATATTNITIQSNMIGVMDDGTAEFTNQIGISCRNYQNITSL